MSERTLAIVLDGQLIPVCDLSDHQLAFVLHDTHRKIIGAKLAYGHVSLSKLTLDYLIAEAEERGISTEPNH